MKKGILLLLAFLISYELTFSQENIQQKDSIIYSTNPEEYFTVEDIISEQQFNRMGIFNAIPALKHPFEDIFVYNAYNVFDVAFFKIRGYDMAYQNVSINGYSMNSPLFGNPNFAQWAGLNHLFLTPEIAIGLNPSDFSMGNIGGAVNYNIRASAYQKQFRALYSLSNSVYDHRLMLTGATGEMGNGWSMAASLSGRFGTGMNYVYGQKFNSLSYLLAVEKKINPKHALNLTFFGSPTQENLRAAALGEAYDILENNYYNPGWGWSNDKQRHANKRNMRNHVAMLSHYYTSSDKKYTVTSSLTSTFEKDEMTNLNWKNANSPWAEDNYLPSQQNGPEIQDYVADQWRNNVNMRQIDWDYMYRVNQLAARQGKAAHYMVNKTTSKQFQFGGASNMTVKFNDHIKLSAGINIRGVWLKKESVVDDLLGGAYWSAFYNDLKRGDILISMDDDFFTQRSWGVVNFTYDKIEFHAGIHDEMSNMYAFPEYAYARRYGFFFSYGAQAGISYKINTHHRLALNALFDQNTDKRFKKEAFSSDISYTLDYPIVQMRATGYYTKFIDKSKGFLFYDNTLNELFAIYVDDMNRQHIGIELGAKIKTGKMFALTLAGNFGDYTYHRKGSVNSKKNHVTNTPQIAGTFGVEFNHKGWYANINANYFDKMYIDKNTLQELTEFFDGENLLILSQEKLKGQFTLDLAAGKAWKIDKYTLAFNITVKNALNNKNLITTASQLIAINQLENSQNYYYYALGTTFNAGINLRF